MFAFILFDLTLLFASRDDSRIFRLNKLGALLVIHTLTFAKDGWEACRKTVAL
jgi:hypothetical protein